MEKLTFVRLFFSGSFFVPKIAFSFLFVLVFFPELLASALRTDPPLYSQREFCRGIVLLWTRKDEKAMNRTRKGECATRCTRTRPEVKNK